MSSDWLKTQINWVQCRVVSGYYDFKVRSSHVLIYNVIIPIITSIISLSMNCKHTQIAFASQLCSK